MAKKKTINLNEPLRDAEPFTEGVLITYKHQTIAQSADTAEYALLTEDSIVEENIDIAYRKPEPEQITITIEIYVGESETPVDETSVTNIAGAEVYKTIETPATAGKYLETQWADAELFPILKSREEYSFIMPNVEVLNTHSSNHVLRVYFGIR